MSDKLTEKMKDLTGMRFGRLIAIEFAGTTKHGKAMWLCRCDCGNVCKVLGTHLSRGDTRSCGCLYRKTHTRHGECKTRLYGIWEKMIQRCENPKNNQYKNYGGRGIRVCRSWRESFEAFRDWALGHGYRDDLTLDRIDNDGDYCPENCRWATMKEQGRNRRTNKLLTHNGETHCVSEWAEVLDISRPVLSSRLQRGWNFEKALTAPRQKHCLRILTYRGKSQNASAWAREIGINKQNLLDRIDRGWSVEDALTIPSRQRRSAQIISYSGKSQGLSAWSRDTGINVTTLHARIYTYGWDIEKALTTPVQAGSARK